MNRFDVYFQNKKQMFIPFFTLGDPNFEASFELIKSVIDAGADALELGFAFSDPIADGPTNQRSMIRALKSGMDFDRSLELLQKIREYNTDIPIGLLLYYNLLYRRGVDTAIKELSGVGVDAIISGDLPIEEGAEFEAACREHNMGVVYFVAPNTSDERARDTFEKCSAYTYVLSGGGTTGAKANMDPKTLQRIAHLRSLTDKPLVVGFGISKPEHVRGVWEAGAEGAIVGSHFTKLIEDDLNKTKQTQVAQGQIKHFIQELKTC